MSGISVIYKIIPKRQKNIFDIFHYATAIQDKMNFHKGIKTTHSYWVSKKHEDKLLFTDLTDTPLFIVATCKNYNDWKTWNQSD